MEKQPIDVTMADGKIATGHILFTFMAHGDEFIIYEIDDTAYGAKLQPDGTIKAVDDDEWKLIEPLFEEYMETHEE